MLCFSLHSSVSNVKWQDHMSCSVMLSHPLRHHTLPRKVLRRALRKSWMLCLMSTRKMWFWCTLLCVCWYDHGHDIIIQRLNINLILLCVSWYDQGHDIIIQRCNIPVLEYSACHRQTCRRTWAFNSKDLSHSFNSSAQKGVSLCPKRVRQISPGVKHIKRWQWSNTTRFLGLFINLLLLTTFWLINIGYGSVTAPVSKKKLRVTIWTNYEIA